MRMNRTILAFGIAFLFAGLPTLAEAAPLRVTIDLQVRSGPGTDHPVVGEVSRGQKVDVSARRHGWARIGYARWVRGGHFAHKRPAPKSADAVAAYYNTTSTPTGIASADPVFGQKPGTWEWERMHLLRHAH